MKRMLVLGLVVLFAFGTVIPVLASGEDCGCTFTVTNLNHTQVLGGKSGHNSHGGLHNAAEHSTVVTHNPG